MNQNSQNNVFRDSKIYDELEPIVKPKLTNIRDCVLSYKILSLDEKKKVEEFLGSQPKPVKKKQLRIFARATKISYTKIVRYLNRCAERKEKQLKYFEADIFSELKRIWNDVDDAWVRYVSVSEYLVKNYFYRNK